jgi:hypothetical protein
MKRYAAPRTVLVFAILGTLVFGWLGISSLLEGAEIWRPILALTFAVVWLVVGLNIWLKSKASVGFRHHSSYGRDRATDEPNGGRPR